ncbi:Proteinase inhibitor [Venturia nashicola]|uniref:Proteinase inhibitor n=1 Tax=Venturia nashicola TaxID=86259 RepID=A0A4Z1PCA6_9PEZI|nr:Proteinase inhibitor [Venturia nashicola]TLD31978.1 Proteinase inhibitor [Venturia nashicola]
MKLTQPLFLPFVLLAGSVAAVAQLKSVIVTFPKGTPDNVVTQAREAVIAAGGVITHDYDKNFIQGFAATASAKAFDTVNALSSAYNPTIEEDQIISIAHDS